MLVVGGKLLLRCRIVGGQRGGKLVLDLLDQRVAFRLAVSLGVKRIFQAIANL